MLFFAIIQLLSLFADCTLLAVWYMTYRGITSNNFDEIEKMVKFQIGIFGFYCLLSLIGGIIA